MAKQVLERTSKRFYRALLDYGFRLTEPRRALIDCLLAQPGWKFQARELHRVLDSASPGIISRATVYRNLDLLVEAGVLDKTRIADNLWQFQLSTKNQQACHYHLIDSATGRVASFAVSPELRAALRNICAEHGFKEQYHVLELFGQFGRKGRKPATTPAVKSPARQTARQSPNGAAPHEDSENGGSSKSVAHKRSGLTADAASE